MCMMNIDEACNYLWANTFDEKNTKWILHSINVGIASKIIANHIPNMDSTLALTCGLLHDIGRQQKDSFMRHSIVGYNHMKEQGYNLHANVCLTHSFYLKDASKYQGKINCVEYEMDIIDKYMQLNDLTLYEELIQLTDAMGTFSGLCIIEERLIDVSLRTGVKEFTLDIWKEILRLKKKFDSLVGANIYEFLFYEEMDLFAILHSKIFHQANIVEEKNVL